MKPKATAAQKKAWGSMSKAAAKLNAKQGAAVTLCVSAFAEGHLIGASAGIRDELPPDARRAMEALTTHIMFVLEAHARQRGGIPVDPS